MQRDAEKLRGLTWGGKLRLLGLKLGLAITIALAGCAVNATTFQSATSFEFTYAGDALGPADVGFACAPACVRNLPGGGIDAAGVSDQGVVALPDGRIRLYFNKHNPDTPGVLFGIGSAISKDGIHFVVEAGDRIPVVNGMSPGLGFVFPLPTGGYRLFYFRGGPHTLSATSPDGLTFADDSGIRLAGNAFAEPRFGGPTCTAIVALADGRYRMYCTQVVTDHVAGGGPSKGSVFSAVSQDLLTWTPEPGVRLGPGSNLPNDAGHPTVLRAPKDGPLRMIYHAYNYETPVNELGVTVTRKFGTAEILVESTDGLVFDNPIITGVNGAEVAFAERSDGQGLLYYAKDVGGGAGIRVADVTGVASGPAINLLDPGDPVPAGSGHAITISTAPGSQCSIKTHDAKGSDVLDPALNVEPIAGAEGLIAWGFMLPKTLPSGDLTATFTCTLGDVSRTRTVSFTIGQP